MNLSELRTKVADDGNVSTNVSGVSARLTREINRAGEEIWRSRAWTFRWRTYRIITDVDVSSGSVTATNGSRTVTASGTPFLSNHVGWHIYFPGDATQNWYQVNVVTSTSQIELDVPYQGTTGSGKAYILRHLDYVLPTEISDLPSLTITYSGLPIEVIETTGFARLFPPFLATSYPTACAIIGSDSIPTTYSTGTVTGTINTSTLTGSGTSWLSNVYPGDDLTIGSYTYRVHTVKSDTSIILYNNLQVAASASSYTVTRKFGRVIRIFWPSSVNYTIEIAGLRKYAPLVNDADSNELIDRMPEALIKKAALTELKSQNDRREMEASAERALANAKAEDDALTIRGPVAPIFTYRGKSGRERWFR